MKKLVFAFLLLFSTVTATSGWGSGSDTVYLSVRSNQYSLTNAIRELAKNPQVFDLLESFTRPIYFAKVGEDEYEYVASYTRAGLEVKVGFEGYEDIVFRYYPYVDTIVGFNSKSELIILTM